MTWLVQEIWLWMALAALAGAVLTGFFSTTEIKVERWVPTPVPEEAPDDGVESATAKPVTDRVEEPEVFASPFPEFQASSGPRPWEEEDLWSRPVQQGSSEHEPEPEPQVAVEAMDEWGEAAAGWRGWDEVTAAENHEHHETLSEGSTAEADELPGTPVETSTVAELADEPVAEPTAESTEEAVPPAELTESVSGEVVDAATDLEVEAELEGAPAAELLGGEVEQPQVEELSPAEKIRLELARLEAEMAKREQRRLELLEAERTGQPAPEPAEPVTGQPEEAAVAPVAPVRKPRKRPASKQLTVVVEEAAPVQTTPEQATPEQLEAERLESERLAAEKAARNKARAQRAAATRAARKQAAQADAERAETERLEAERAATERAEAERAEAERAEAERAEAERLEAERAEAERQEVEAEKARLKAERAAAARARAKAKREEAARVKAAQAAAENAAAEQAEALQEASEQVEAERLEQRLPDEAPPVSGPTWLDPADESDAWKQGPFGPGSAYAAFDGTPPRGCTVKANLTTRLYHSRSSRFYSRTQADVWFETEEHAEAAGFIRWDKRGTMAHALQGEQRSEGPAA